MKTITKKIIVGILTLAIFVTSLQSTPLSFAQEKTTLPFSMPEAFGKIESSQYSNPKAKTIIYIQDAHDSLDAQKNIAKLILHFVKTSGVKTVYEEGYEGSVPTQQLFGWIKSEKIKKKIADFLLDRLRIGGAEYAHVASLNKGRGSKVEGRNETGVDPSSFHLPSSTFNLIGADNIELYKKNISAFRSAAKNNSVIRRDLDAMLKEIQSLANLRFPEPLKNWLKDKESFETKKLDLTTYLTRSLKLVPISSSRVNFPNISLILAAEKSRHIWLVEKARGINSGDLFQELELLESSIAKTFLMDEISLTVFNYRESIRLLKRLNDIEVNSDEYLTARQRLSTLKTEELANFIARESRRSIVLSKSWERSLRQAIEFYEIAHQRDSAIKERLASFIGQTDEKVAVLVYGGFHKAGIISILENLGVNYVVISPKIKAISARHQAYYKQLMTIGHHDFEKPFLASLATRPPSLYLDLALAQSEVIALASEQSAALTSRGRDIFKDNVATNLRPETRNRDFQATLSIGNDGQKRIVEHNWSFLANRANITRHYFASTAKGLFVPTMESYFEKVLAQLPNPDQNFTLFDAGSGQGIFALALAVARPKAKIIAVEFDQALYDDSLKLLETAIELGWIKRDQITFIHGDFNSADIGSKMSEADYIYYYSSGTSRPERLMTTLENNTRPGTKLVVLKTNQDSFSKDLLTRDHFDRLEGSSDVSVLVRRAETRSENLIHEDSLLARYGRGIGVNFFVPVGEKRFGFWQYALPDLTIQDREKIHGRLIPVFKNDDRKKPSTIRLVFYDDKPILIITDGIAWSQLPETLREANERSLILTLSKNYSALRPAAAMKKAKADFDRAVRTKKIALGYFLSADASDQLPEKAARWFESQTESMGTYGNLLFSPISLSELKSPIVIFADLYKPNTISSTIFRRYIRPKPGSFIKILGTGPGVDALTTAKRADGNVAIVATDIDPLAVENARLVVEQSNYKNRITVYLADLFEHTKSNGEPLADAVYFNIPIDMEGGNLATMDSGMALLTRLLNEASDYLKPNGTLEINYADNPKFMAKIYSQGWEPALIEGYDFAREHFQNHVWDYVRFSLKKMTPERRAALTLVTEDWQTLGDLHNKYVKQELTQMTPQERELVEALREKYESATDLNAQLLYKAVYTMSQFLKRKPYQLAVDPVLINEAYTPEVVIHGQIYQHKKNLDLVVKVVSVDLNAEQFVIVAYKDGKMLGDRQTIGLKDEQSFLNDFHRLPSIPLGKKTRFEARSENAPEGSFTLMDNPAAWEIVGQGNNRVGFVVSTIRRRPDPSDLAQAWDDFHRLVFEFPKIYEHAAQNKHPLVLVVPETLDGLTPLDPLSTWIEGARTTLAWASAYARFANLHNLDLRILKVPESALLENNKIQSAALHLLKLSIPEAPNKTAEEKVISRIFDLNTLLPNLVEEHLWMDFKAPHSIKELPYELSPPALAPGQKRAVLSGGAGFLGSHIAKRLLDKGYQVVIIDNLLSGNAENLKPFENHPSGLIYYQGDISKPITIKGDVHAVLHFASLATPGDYYDLPKETLLSGLEGTKNMLDLAQEKGARFLTSSTSEVYGQPLVHPQPETYAGNVNPIGKRSQYDQSKRGGETLVKLYYEKYGVDVRISRIFNTYGPGMRFGEIHDTRLIPNFIKAVLDERPMEMFGGGSQTRSFAFVDDTISGLLALLETNKLATESPVQDRVFNIGNPDEFTVQELAEKLVGLAQKHLHKKATFVSVPNPDKDDPLKRQPDISKAQAVLGFTPTTNLDAGLETTFLDFYRQFQRRSESRMKTNTDLSGKRTLFFDELVTLLNTTSRVEHLRMVDQLANSLTKDKLFGVKTKIHGQLFALLRHLKVQARKNTSPTLLDSKPDTKKAALLKNLNHLMLQKGFWIERDEQPGNTQAPYLLKTNFSHPEILSLKGARHPEINNADSFKVKRINAPNASGTLLLVADGFGSRPSHDIQYKRYHDLSVFVKEHFPIFLEKALADLPANSVDYQKAINDAYKDFHLTSRTLYAKLREGVEPESLYPALVESLRGKNYRDEGSTLTSVFIPDRGDKAYVLMLGDSPAMFFDNTGIDPIFSTLPIEHNVITNKNEQERQLSRSKKPFVDNVGRIGINGPAVQVSRAFFLSKIYEDTFSLSDPNAPASTSASIAIASPEVFEISLDRNQPAYLLLGSDGIFSSIDKPRDEVARDYMEAVRAGLPLKHLLPNPKSDDATMIVWKIPASKKQAMPKRSEARSSNPQAEPSSAQYKPWQFNILNLFQLITLVAYETWAALLLQHYGWFTYAVTPRPDNQAGITINADIFIAFVMMGIPAGIYFASSLSKSIFATKPLSANAPPRSETRALAPEQLLARVNWLANLPDDGQMSLEDFVERLYPNSLLNIMDIAAGPDFTRDITADTPREKRKTLSVISSGRDGEFLRNVFTANPRLLEKISSAYALDYNYLLQINRDHTVTDLTPNEPRSRAPEFAKQLSSNSKIDLFFLNAPSPNKSELPDIAKEIGALASKQAAVLVRMHYDDQREIASVDSQLEQYGFARVITLDKALKNIPATKYVTGSFADRSVFVYMRHPEHSRVTDMLTPLYTELRENVHKHWGQGEISNKEKIRLDKEYDALSRLFYPIRHMIFDPSKTVSDVEELIKQALAATRAEVRIKQRERSPLEMAEKNLRSRGHLFISTNDLNGLTPDQQDELFKVAFASKSEVRFVLYGESDPAESKAVTAFLKLPNVKRLRTNDLNAALRQFPAPQENRVLLQDDQAHGDFGKMKRVLLKKELGRIAFAKRVALEGAQGEGVIDPSLDLLQDIIKSELAQLVVAYAA